MALMLGQAVELLKDEPKAARLRRSAQFVVREILEPGALSR